VVVTATHGDPSARIYEIRAYADTGPGRSRGLDQHDPCKNPMTHEGVLIMRTMHPSRRHVLAAGTVAGTAALALSACGSGGGGGNPNAPEAADPKEAKSAWGSEEDVTISISDLPSKSKPDIRKARESVIKEFEKANPHITVEPEETTWAADTFPAMLASDTVPTFMNIPFTEMAAMIARGQAADVTDFVALDDALKDTNPTLVDLTKGPDGRQYGIPLDGYTMALFYNRALFEKAGLDPEEPPSDWDQVREHAKTVADETGAQGFLFMTKDNNGGWVFTPIVNGFGGSPVSEDGSKATMTDPAVKKALEFYRTLRWDDDVAGSNFLIGFDDANQSFAGGKAAMYVAPANQYGNIVTALGMKPEDLGIAPCRRRPTGSERSRAVPTP
jgi:multiple sugar transport system substrate-binding protein